MGATLPSRIYLSPPDIGLAEREFVRDAFDSNWIAPLGPHVDAFERELADFVKVPHAAALSSGTAALHLALLCHGVGRDHTVLTSTLTFSATANAITYVGATPGFIDVSPETWQLDPDLLAEDLASRAQDESAAGRGHQRGSVRPVCRLRSAESVCGQHNVPLIEDAAEALGASCGASRRSFGTCGVFSFAGTRSSPPAAAACSCHPTSASSSASGTTPRRRASPRLTTNTPRLGSTTV